MWSLPPAMSSSGPRVALSVSTLAGESGHEVGGGGLEQRLARATGSPSARTARRTPPPAARCRSRSGTARGSARPPASCWRGCAARPTRRAAPTAAGRRSLDRGGVDRDARGGRGPGRAAAGRSGRRTSGRSRSAWRSSARDDLGVVVDDVVDAVPGDAVGLAAGLLDRVGVARPARRDRRVAAPRGRARPRGPRSRRAATGRG